MSFVTLRFGYRRSLPPMRACLLRENVVLGCEHPIVVCEDVVCDAVGGQPKNKGARDSGLSGASIAMNSGCLDHASSRSVSQCVREFPRVLHLSAVPAMELRVASNPRSFDFFDSFGARSL